jgi:hypothetical protein
MLDLKCPVNEYPAYGREWYRTSFDVQECERYTHHLGELGLDCRKATGNAEASEKPIQDLESQVYVNVTASGFLEVGHWRRLGIKLSEARRGPRGDQVLQRSSEMEPSALKQEDDEWSDTSLGYPDRHCTECLAKGVDQRIILALQQHASS